MVLANFKRESRAGLARTIYTYLPYTRCFGREISK